MTKTMRAARMHAVAEPMRLENVPVPVPGPRDVLVSVRAVNIVPNLANILDNWTSWFPTNPLATLPAIFGLDPAGVWIGCDGGLFLRSSEAGEACVCDLNEAFDLTQATISHHLKVLHSAGILDREKRGVWVYYAVRPAALSAVANVFSSPALAGANA